MKSARWGTAVPRLYTVPSSATTTFTAADLGAALVDMVVNYADPNGNIFASEYMGDLLIEGYGISLKQKASAMETFDLVGPTQLAIVDDDPTDVRNERGKLVVELGEGGFVE